jgi:hypothetical protein
MAEILLEKKEALRIALTILNKEKTLEDYGFTAINESQLILKNILETLLVEEEMMAPPELPKPKPKPRKPNKKLQDANMAYFGKILDGMEESDKEGKTILDLEGGK